MTTVTIKPADVRAAREFLRKRGIRGMSPRKFATAAKEAGVSFQRLLQLLGGAAQRALKNPRQFAGSEGSRAEKFARAVSGIQGR